MKKIIILSVLSIVLLSCSNTAKTDNIDDLISAKNVKALNEKKTALQADIAKIESALATLDVKKEEALVSVLTLKDTIFNHYLDIQGNVNTKENILVQPEFSGTLTSLTVKAGDRVSRGQILGRVDDGGLSQQLASAQNQYSLAKTTFERQKNLWDKKIGSEIQYLQAQTQMVSAQKAVAQINAQLARTVIRAPFSGTIDEVFAEKGQVVAPSATGLMRIVNLGNMYVSTSVPETYIGKLRLGDQVDVYLSSLGKTYKGKVRQVGSYINPNNRTFGIEVSVPNPENLLRPNQVAKLKITDYTSKNAIVVPTGVIQEDGKGDQYVYVVEGSNGKTGTAKKVVVKVGKSSDNVTEILSGLSANDIIVTEGANTISEGMKLNF
ncbi:efflux RND transporter periplasmic adaptor subunit [Flavobacterium sp. AS60]|uniref:efflux RND transporter periplasmic adaptor subunit n=1 Tax=Flavobacterium anseongense TaxID=2910677 RepID=UPI001F27E020|nr:efflux RND transporter periplasmic adaptor subunit [Flavobacterium sp. AS60]MCF6129300.1 efflux RND transporter periplasmic adaptor subunit [Flavobacterium sp. AS60]